MKILRISLRNIASLAGTHTVDFTQDPLLTAGLFSISGPTGAGKSSLLDALCLALYDKTPRLNRIGQLEDLTTGERQNDPRTLLRRGATEGFAEVAFVGVDAKPWTSRWSVRRAHNRADGNLQQTDITLFRGHIDVGSESHVEAGGKKTEVLAAIAAKISLTFEQFTRAVLLAQNDFATFLKANDKERAEILQALTGTEQFEAISRAVYERASQEKETIASLTARLHGQQSMTPEEREAAETQLQTATARQTELEQQIQQLNSHVEWFAEYKRRFEQLRQSTVHRNATEQKLKDAEPRQRELQHTEQIQREARPLREAQAAAEDQLKLSNESLSEITSDYKKHQENLQQLDMQLEQAIKQRTALEEKQTSLRPQLARARELDARLAPAATRLQQAKNQHDELTRNMGFARDNLQDAQFRQTQLAAEVEDLNQRQQQLIGLMPFAEEASLWVSRLDAAIESASAMARAQNEVKLAQIQHQTANEELKKHQQLEPALQKSADQAATLLKEAQHEEAAFDVNQLTQSRQRCTESQVVLMALQHYCRDRSNLQIDVARLAGEIAVLNQHNQQDSQTLEQLRQTEIPKAEAAHEAATNSLLQIQSAMDDAARRLRSSLQQDAPCPVCGSVQHPYSQHAPDVEAAAIKAAQKTVKDYEKQLRSLTEHATKLEVAISARSSGLNQSNLQYQSTVSQLQQLAFVNAHHDEAATILNLDEMSQGNAIERRLTELKNEQASIEKLESALRSAALKKEHCRQQYDLAHTELKQLQQQLASLEKGRALAAANLKNCERNMTSVQTQHANACLPLQQLWAAIPNADVQFSEDPVTYRDVFRHQANDCLQISRQLRNCQTELQQINSNLTLLQSAFENANLALSRSQQELKSASEQHKQLATERAALLDGKKADDVEHQLTEELRESTLSREQLAKSQTETDKLVRVTSSQLQTAKQAVVTAQARHTEITQQLQNCLRTFATTSGRTLSQIELDEMLSRSHQWIQTERQALEQLRHDLKTADGTIHAYTEQLRQHEAKRPTADDESVVAAALTAAKQQLQTAKEDTDAARTKMHSDDQIRKQNERLVTEIAAAQAKADPWIKLNELIGSADGAKFRMIAQRRTLDILLGYANAHLDQLAGRYRLDRLPESLNLIVADRDMADERRSIHSLSGGESFLVSLALALGLASLTSNRLRIESLFIDEGFGSLDPETLNTAMNALMHLEAQGRKVGVISHVTEMTDAIPVQVKIVKGRNGASRIVIPGAKVDRLMADSAAVDGAAAEQSADEGTSPNSSENAIHELADKILAILKDNQTAGKPKTSIAALRKELGCTAKQFSTAQAHLGNQVTVEGRSLRISN